MTSSATVPSKTSELLPDPFDAAVTKSTDRRRAISDNAVEGGPETTMGLTPGCDETKA